MMLPTAIVAEPSTPRLPRSRVVTLLLFVMTVTLPTDAAASLLSPQVEDKLATIIALFVIFVVPAVLIALFWMVHILPEKIAHKRNHPQFEAIRTLCLLSLVFGGLLWPFAWLWAYSRPVFHKMAYGTDTHPDAMDDGHRVSETEPAHVSTLRQRIALLEARVPPKELEVLRADVDALETRFSTEAR